MAGNINANDIAKWDGAAWNSLSNGINGPFVLSMSVYSSELYVGGLFYSADSNSVNNITKFDGINWHAVGSGMNQGGVYALAVYNGELYAGGSFKSP